MAATVTMGGSLYADRISSTCHPLAHGAVARIAEAMHARDILPSMPRRSTPRTAVARVVDGQIRTRARFPDGTRLIVHVDDPGPPVELTAEDERAIDKALASVRAGRPRSAAACARRPAHTCAR